MFNNIISNFVNKLSIADVNNFALKNNINLNSNELDFTYNFIKNNYKNILDNPNNFDLTQYKTKFSDENFVKIEKLFNEYLFKYSSYLK